MHIALFGGSFDPPHNGHLLIARAVLQYHPGIDEVWLLPTYAHHWKPMHASPQDRLEMTRLLGEKKIHVSDMDVTGKIRYAIETIQFLQKETRNSYVWVGGADTVTDFHRWKEYRKLQKLLSFLVIPRKGIETLQLPENFSLFDKKFGLVPYSSTEIRERIKNGESITGMVPEKVREYITKKGLYK